MSGYDKDKLYAQAIELAREENTFTVEDVFTLMPCSKSTFYAYFPDGSDELDAIKELLEQNKVRMKVKLRSKLALGERAAEIIALYKLIATDDERRALSMTSIDHTNNGKEFQAQTVIIQSTGEIPEKT